MTLGKSGRVAEGGYPYIKYFEEYKDFSDTACSADHQAGFRNWLVAQPTSPAAVRIRE